MVSPGSLKGQSRGTCGHAMAAFDLHERCARCHDKKVGDDPCVKTQDCVICETLSTPSYRIRKDGKSGSLVSPKDVTIINAVDMEGQASPHLLRKCLRTHLHPLPLLLQCLFSPQPNLRP